MAFVKVREQQGLESPMLWRRTDQEQADSEPFHGLGTWFEMDSEPRFVLTAQGRLEHANAQGAALMVTDRIRVNSDNFITFGDRASDGELHEILTGGGVRSQPFVARLRDGTYCSAELRFLETGPIVLTTHVPPPGSASERVAPVGRRFGLTVVETAVLAGLSDGHCPKQIARSQNLSEHTIRLHLRAIYAKLGVRGLTDAALAAVRLGRRG